MAVDQILYERLGVPSNADKDSIRAAYKIQALKYHPDRNPGGEEQFKRISEAYEVLSTSAKKRKYDKDGFQKFFDRSPDDKDSSPSEDSLELFQATMQDDAHDAERKIDMEIELLLSWWSRPEVKRLKSKEALHVDSDDFYLQLSALFDQYRLTHQLTVGKDSRSTKATEHILEIAGRDFGDRNLQTLMSWSGDRPLESAFGNSYFDKNDKAQTIRQQQKRPELPESVFVVYLARSEDFAEFVDQDLPRSGNVSNRLQKLSQEYENAWAKADRALEQAPKSHRDILSQYSRSLNWDAVTQHLRDLRDQAKTYKADDASGNAVTNVKVAEAVWQKDVKDHGVPPSWQKVVGDKIMKGVELKYSPSQVQKSGPKPAHLEGASEDDDQTQRNDGDVRSINNAEDEMDWKPESSAISKKDETSEAGDDNDQETNATISKGFTVIDDDNIERSVYAWHRRGRGHQLFLCMTPKTAGLLITHIVPGADWKGDLHEFQDNGGLNLESIKGHSSDLVDRRLPDFIWTAIHMHRRKEDREPPGGRAAQSPLYVEGHWKGEGREQRKFIHVLTSPRLGVGSRSRIESILI